MGGDCLGTESRESRWSSLVERGGLMIGLVIGSNPVAGNQRIFMLTEFLTIFEQTCIALIDYIPAVLGIWLVFNLTASLIFGRS